MRAALGGEPAVARPRTRTRRRSRRPAPGSGKCARSRWSRRAVVELVRTRRNRSPARSSSVVRTVDGDGLVAARASTTARRRSRAPASGRSRSTSSRARTGPGLEHRRRAPLRPVDDRVVGGRRVVVGVAAVAAVDEPAERRRPRTPSVVDRAACRRRGRPRPAGARSRATCRRRGPRSPGPSPSSSRKRAPAEAGDGVGGEQHLAHAAPCADRMQMRRARVAEREQLLAQLARGRSAASPGPASCSVTSTVPSATSRSTRTRAILRAGELGAPHQLERPSAPSGPMTMVEKPSPVDARDHLGRARRAVVERDEVHRARRRAR